MQIYCFFYFIPLHFISFQFVIFYFIEYKIIILSNKSQANKKQARMRYFYTRIYIPIIESKSNFLPLCITNYQITIL